MQCPNMQIGLRLTRASPTFYMISDNPKVRLGIVDSSFCTRRNGLNGKNYTKRMEILANASVGIKYLDTLAKTFTTTAKQNQMIQENIFKNAPVGRIAIAMDAISAFTGLYTL